MTLAQVPTEFIVYGVLFLLILLFNYIARRLASQQPQQEGPEQIPAEEEQYEAPDEFWGRVNRPIVQAPPPAAARVERPRPRLPAPRSARYTRESLFGSKRDLKRAIVLMTVLGPCRANEQSQQPR